MVPLTSKYHLLLLCDTPLFQTLAIHGDQVAFEAVTKSMKERTGQLEARHGTQGSDSWWKNVGGSLGHQGHNVGITM